MSDFLFNPSAAHADLLSVHINGHPYQLPAAITVSAALALIGLSCTRISTTNMPRTAFCGMGICFECRVFIDGSWQRGCQTKLRANMIIATQSELS